LSERKITDEIGQRLARGIVQHTLSRRTVDSVEPRFPGRYQFDPAHELQAGFVDSWQHFVQEPGYRRRMSGIAGIIRRQDTSREVDRHRWDAAKVRFVAILDDLEAPKVAQLVLYEVDGLDVDLGDAPVVQRLAVDQKFRMNKEWPA